MKVKISFDDEKVKVRYDGGVGVKSKEDFGRFFKYLHNSQKLEDSLNRAKCPDDLKRAFDKVLWSSLHHDPLYRVMTVEEAFKIDNWASSHNVPKGLVLEAVARLKNDLGIVFKQNEKSSFTGKFRIS